MPRVTQKDIARAANVSVSTVSFALSGGGSLSSGTMERIRRIAEEMGYIPNPLLASLASRRFREEPGAQRVPLALLEWPLAFDGNHKVVGNYRRPLLEEARRLGYQTEIQQPPAAIEHFEDLARMLYHRGVQGIVVTGSLPLDFLRRFEPRHFAWDQSEVARRSILLMDQLIRQKESGIPPKPLQLLISSLWVEGRSIQIQRNF